jgi:hypothetical protein
LGWLRAARRASFSASSASALNIAAVAFGLDHDVEALVLD